MYNLPGIYPGLIFFGGIPPPTKKFECPPNFFCQKYIFTIYYLLPSPPLPSPKKRNSPDTLSFARIRV